MSEPFENLAERIRHEVSDLDDVLDRAGQAWQLVQQGPPEQYAYVDSVALNLHSNSRFGKIEKRRFRPRKERGL